ncbi:MAG: FAD-dependent oxidoreductase [Desulfobacterales bacterium]|nr:FAD-dependent oxidoreductase [Desulfobacterales bacterium]
MNYPHVFQPFNLGSITLKNRLVMSPMTMNYATEDGRATDKLIRHYLERAKGGVGLIMVEGTYFTPEGKGYLRQLGLCSTEHARALEKMTQAVHALGNGAKIFIQLHHAGARTSAKITGLQPVAPSGVSAYPGGEIPHALTVPEIKELVRAHVQTAVWAKEAGFDGIDLHCAHGYLIPAFLSPLSNRRSDAYGGDLAGRTRFLLEIIAGIKERLGAAYPLTIKISGDEFMEGGLRIDEMIRVAQIAQQAGIDGITVSAGSVGGKKRGSLEQAHQILRTMPMMTAPGCLVPLAEKFKENLNIPVITVGRINHPSLAEDILAQGRADLVAMGRPLLADPYLPQKAMDGKEADIRLCIACNEGCYKRIFQQLDIRCAINPMTGREDDAAPSQTPAPKAVVIVGGGPAGLEAAYSAWQRGHKVTLMEENRKLGGQLNLAASAPGRSEIENIRQFLVKRLAATDVAIITGQKASVELIRPYRPDIVICATGARPRTVDIPGLQTHASMTAWEAIAGTATPVSPCLVVGGGLVGCEAADYLSEHGHRIVLVEILPGIASDGDADTQAFYDMKFAKNKVAAYTATRIERIDRHAAVLERDGETITVPIESIVLAVGAEPIDSLSEELAAAGISCVKIGDCVTPRRILDAVHEGFQAGCAL